MQDNELEKILQEKADKKQLRKFSEVWEDIKHEVTVEEKPQKKFNFKRWFPLALTSVAVIVCLAFTPLIMQSLKPAPEELYYSDELDTQNVLETEMLSGLAQASIIHVDLTRYELEGCKLLVTEDNLVKGASFRMCDIPTTFFATINIYDKNVDSGISVDDTYSNHKISSTTVYYKFAQDNGGSHEYTAYAVRNNVQYLIQYMGVPDTLLEFLTDFFA